MPSAIRTVRFPAGDEAPVLGQGTWGMGERPARRDEEVAALRLGIDLGMTLIDTAEMYADGKAEEVVRDAIAGRRDEVYIVTKVLPSHASRLGVISACNNSLKRLHTDRIDLYLLHWRGSGLLRETVDAFEELKAAGKIVNWGVSNFDTADMVDLLGVPHGRNVQTNQVLYNLMRRGIEYDLMPWCHQRHIPIMAYSPIEQGVLTEDARIAKIAARYGATNAQIALAWVLRREGVIVIPKAGSEQHVRENRAAYDIHLTREDLAELDRIFAPPTRKMPLELL